MKKLRFLLCAFTLLGSFDTVRLLVAQTGFEGSPMTPRARTPVLQMVSTFALLHNQPAILIIGQDKHLCRAESTSPMPDDVTAIERLVETAVPGYKLFIQKRVMVVEPNDLDSASAKLVDLIIPAFRTRATDMSGTDAYLWRDVEGVLHPEHGSAYSRLSSPDNIRISPMSLDNASVLQILEAIVVQGGGGVAMIDAVPSDFAKEYTERSLVSTMSFHDDGEMLKTLNCR